MEADRLVKDYRYGHSHRMERLKWAKVVESGHGWCCEPVCIKSSRWIPPGSKWHLSHDPTGTFYLGCSHEQCNESEGSKRKYGKTAGQSWRRTAWLNPADWGLVDESHERCRHEAGHCTVAHRLGWSVLSVTAVPGRCWGGSARIVPPASSWAEFDGALPFALWPAEARASLESEVLISLAGQAAAELFAWQPGRVAEPVTAEVAEQLAAEHAAMAAGLPAGVREWARSAVDEDDAGEDDDARVLRLMRTAHGADLASAHAHLDFMAAQVRAVVRAEQPRIALLARSLEVCGVLDAEQIAAVLNDALRTCSPVRGYPQVPAGTAQGRAA